MDSSEASVVVSPVKRIRGELRLPGDKSISHRAAMIASLADGESRLENFSSAQDCIATISCLQALGVEISQSGSSVVVHGTGSSGLAQPHKELNVQNSGTTMRLLAGILAGQPFTTTLTGDASLLSRPMLRVAEPLRLMGAQVELEANGFAPLRIEGRRPLSAINYQLPIASAQLKSAILLAGLAAEGVTTIEEPAPTRDHTERMLPEFGVSIEKSGNRVSINGGQKLTPCNLEIPGDISSAAYLVAAATALPGSELSIRDGCLNPTRIAFVSLLQTLGAKIVIEVENVRQGEPVGSIHVEGSAFPEAQKIEIHGSMVSQLIDELPLLAFFAASIRAEMILRDAGELRFKESDRITATVQNLTRMGARIEELEDGWWLQSGAGLHGALLDSYGDHRVAMSCAVAALSAREESQIEGARDAVSVSLPEFWTLLESVVD
jgi:3-phosphoshikimate 1-carboxyvinyltransferase